MGGKQSDDITFFTSYSLVANNYVHFMVQNNSISILQFRKLLKLIRRGVKFVQSDQVDIEKLVVNHCSVQLLTNGVNQF